MVFQHKTKDLSPHSNAALHIFIFESVLSGTHSNHILQRKPDISQWEVMFHNDIRFATVYRNIFLILSNQKLQYIGICIRMSVVLPRLQMIPYLFAINRIFPVQFQKYWAWILLKVELFSTINRIPSSWRKEIMQGWLWWRDYLRFYMLLTYFNHIKPRAGW